MDAYISDEIMPHGVLYIDLRSANNNDNKEHFMNKEIINLAEIYTHYNA